MSAAWKPEFLRTITFRLTVWYAGLFLLSVMLLLGMVYVSVVRQTKRRVDRALREEIEEISARQRAVGFEAMRANLLGEGEAVGEDDVEVRVLSADGRALVATSSNLWESLGDQPIRNWNRHSAPLRFMTLTPAGGGTRIRVGMAPLGARRVVQVAQPLTDVDAILDLLSEKIAALAGVMLFLAGVGGWFMARRALAGIHRVAQAASRIESGDLGQRVSLAGEGAEVERLAGAFNAMAARIQALVAEWKEVSSNIAHDLRSPITRMRGMAETTLTGPPTLETYRELASGVVEESDRLIGMINTMLEIAETESGVQALNRTDVNLTALLREAADLFLPVAEEGAAHLETHLPAAPLTLAGDAPRLQRAIANLLDNAIKYTPAGGHIELRAEATGTDVIVTVEDNGAGIAAKDLPRIFDRFYRGDQSRSTPGNGLGLSLVQSIVRAHGGTIRVTSEVGAGTRFVVTLPRQAAHRDAHRE